MVTEDKRYGIRDKGYAIWALLVMINGLSLICLICPRLLSAQSRYTFTQPAMGTEFRIIISTQDTLGLGRTIKQAFQRIAALEQSMSDYRADSELNQLKGNTRWQRVSPDLYTVLRFSKRLARRSRGAFDPTIGPLTKLWRRAFRQQTFPEEEAVLAARTQVQWKDLKISRLGRKVRLRRPDMQLDLGGVAKGYALDQVGNLLREAGFPAFLVDGGGDLLLGDPPVDQLKKWIIAFPGTSKQHPLHNCALATSGDTYRFLEYQGVKYSHIIDPQTGYGVQDQPIITVLCKSAMIADGLASTYVLGHPVIKRYRKYSYWGSWHPGDSRRLPATYE